MLSATVEENPVRRGPFDIQHPFFNPLWRRIAVTTVCALWGLYEWSQDAQIWAILFGAIAVYCAHQFFWAWQPSSLDDDANPPR